MNSLELYTIYEIATELFEQSHHRTYHDSKVVLDFYVGGSVPLCKSNFGFLSLPCQRLENSLIPRNKSRSKWLWSSILPVSIRENIDRNPLPLPSDNVIRALTFSFNPARILKAQRRRASEMNNPCSARG